MVAEIGMPADQERLAGRIEIGRARRGRRGHEDAIFIEPLARWPAE